MSTLVEQLAQRFEEVNRAAIAAVEDLDEAGLRAHCAAEQCTAAALAAHVGEAHPIIADWVRAAAAGEPLPAITMADIDRINAERAAANAQCSKETVLAQLRANGAAAAARLRTLRDEDLERTTPFALFGGAEVSVRALIERVLIGNIEANLPSLREAARA
ncbi:MAG: DinB family protein [Chloroflexota bacterium]|nr:DinB family protein [Chloroflexota bacterium]